MLIVKDGKCIVEGERAIVLGELTTLATKIFEEFAKNCKAGAWKDAVMFTHVMEEMTNDLKDELVDFLCDQDKEDLITCVMEMLVEHIADEMDEECDCCE